MSPEQFQFNLEFAKDQDHRDALASFREEFLFPQFKGGKCLYFTGNSLGLQPKEAKAALELELEDWATWGVEGHFHARNPWYSYHEKFSPLLAELTGSLPLEVVAMNGLTVNLHLLMASFYRPSAKRCKILTERKAFPSDLYAVESQIKFHGYNPQDNHIEIEASGDSAIIEEAEIERVLQEQGDEIALVLLGGVNYYSGQVLDIPRITRAAHNAGAVIGFDLAHAIGNIPLRLHEWGPDFACWCSYKYLNSGPGSVAGAFVHERHALNRNLPRLAGWWGHNKDSRFQMEADFDPIPGAEGWQLSNAPVLSMAVHKLALEQFSRAGMDNLREKSLRLTAYLEFVIEHVTKNSTSAPFELVSPSDPNRRGCQLSIRCHGHGRGLFQALNERGVIADWREPNVIRLAPVPLYNNFEDIYHFGSILLSILNS
jgi:kynureninase